MSPTEKINHLKNNIIETHHKYKSYTPALFFTAGFLFDLMTLGQIDHWATLLQQIVYLVLISSILSMIFFIEQKKSVPPKFLLKHWKYHVEGLHFLLGGLLNAYLLFYFKSGSLASSFFFLIVISIVLLLNETKVFKLLGLKVKFILLALCHLSLSMIVVPIVIGKINWLTFALSIILFVAIQAGFAYFYYKKGVSKSAVRKEFVLPNLGFLSVFVLMYYMNLIPPIPLSVKYIGIYNQVSKQNGKYSLSYNRPFWKFWQSGAQSITLPGDSPIYCFLKIYSPANFKDKIYLKWYLKNKKGKWEQQDKIPLSISGGRKDGFRGFAYKSNHSQGDWKILVVTENNRELSRIYFDVSYGETDQEDLSHEVH